MKSNINAWFYITSIISLVLAYVPFAQLMLFGIGDNIYDGAHLILLPLIVLLNLVAIVTGIVFLVKKFRYQSLLKSGLVAAMILLVLIQLPIFGIYYMMTGVI